MVTEAQEKVRAKSLWSGERFSVDGGNGVYVIKTYKRPGSSALICRAERRLTTMSNGFLGIGRRWKVWDELSTPVGEQDLDQEVTKVP